MRTMLLMLGIALSSLWLTDQAEARGRGGRGGGWGGGWGGWNGGYGYGGYGGYGYGGYGRGWVGGWGYGQPYFTYYNFPGYGYGNSYYGNYPNNYTYAPADPRKLANDEAEILVLVPDPQAEVFFDGQKTTSTGRERVFFPPKLNPGQQYTYTVSASFNRDGNRVQEQRTVQVTPGQPSVVDFTRRQPAEKLAPPATGISPKNR